MEHHILTVEWNEGIPKQYKIQSSARTKRYDAMMGFCTKNSFPTLMTAHHLDDQIGTMLPLCCPQLSLASIPFPPRDHAVQDEQRKQH